MPTHERPELLLRALRSVLAQTRPPAELVVVVDGDSPEATTEVLAALGEPSLRVIVPGRRLGNAEARNLGVRHARGDWIALLDDDDCWAPSKLERQFEALGRTAGWGGDVAARVGARAAVPIASCRLLARAGARRFVWPRLLPRADEPLARYLFCRRWPLSGDRLLQTSTLLAPRALFLEVPFRTGRRFVDQDWLLRCDRAVGLRIVFPEGDAPLVEWDIAPDRPRISHRRDDWRRAVGWARRRRHLLDRRAHAAFLLTLASASAADAGVPGAFWPLLREALREGRPNAAELLTHAANFALSRPLRDALAARANRWLGP